MSPFAYAGRGEGANEPILATSAAANRIAPRIVEPPTRNTLMARAGKATPPGRNHLRRKRGFPQQQPRNTVKFSSISRPRRPCSVSSGALAVLPVADEVVDHGGIGERRGVAEICRLVLGDLAQDAA